MTEFLTNVKIQLTGLVYKTNEVKILSKVCVIGSINMDLVLNTKNLPKKGETILVKDIIKIPGGKGANQAVAASRLGCQVSFVGAVGKDENGQILLESMEKDGVRLEDINIMEGTSTGVAIITVDRDGNNTICVVSGANMELNLEDVEKSKSSIENSDVVITQLETPIEIGEKAFKIAKEFNKITILNPAPAMEIKGEILKYTDIIIPNETEAFELTGVEITDLEKARESAEVFLNKGVKFVVITLGSRGAAVISKEHSMIVPAFKVKAIDTTAAGDSFIGAMSSKLGQLRELNFENIIEAVTLGNKVSSITVTREGAQSSIPTLAEVRDVYGEV